MQSDEPLVIDQAWDNMPALGQEHQGLRPGIVATHADLNRLGMIGCALSRKAAWSNVGLSASLVGTGTQTQGVVLWCTSQDDRPVAARFDPD